MDYKYKTMKKINLILGLTVVILISGCGEEKSTGNKISDSKKSIKVKTIIVEEPTQNIILGYSGIIVPTLAIPLSFQLPGSLNKIYVDEGDHVRKGQTLAELDKTSFQNIFLAAQAMQNQAKDAYDRLKTVHDKGSLPEIQWEEIKSKLEQANSSAQIAKQNLDNCSIIASTQGIIGSRNAEVGSTIIPGNPIFKLVIIDEVFVRVSVPENEINRIKKGQIVRIQIPAIGNDSYSGQVEKIGVMANPISKTYEIKIRVKNTNLKIKSGMVSNVEIIIQDPNSKITIPYQAVIKNGDDHNYVFKVNSKTNTVEKKIVEVGELSNNMIQIISGVSVGDILVVEGQHKLADNYTVIL